MIEQTDQASSKDNVEKAIELHREFLEERIDPDSGLLDKLLANGTLSKKEILEIKDKSPFHKRNAQLLDYILDKRKGDRLISNLRDADQRHISNYLMANAGKGKCKGTTVKLRMIFITFLKTATSKTIWFCVCL